MSDIETIRALNGAARGYARWKPQFGRAGSHAGRVVFRGRPNKPYGIPLGTKGRLTHIPLSVYTAWRHGKVVGALARWRCGGQSRDFALLDRPVLPLCHLCAARGTTVVVLVMPTERECA